MANTEKVSTLAIWGGAVTASAGLLKVMWTTEPWFWKAKETPTVTPLIDLPPPPSVPAESVAALGPAYSEEDDVIYRVSAKGPPTEAQLQEIQWDPMGEPPVQSVARVHVGVGILDFVVVFLGLACWWLGAWAKRRARRG